MREILFRGKRIDNGEWVYGNLNYGTIEIKSIKDSYYISDFDVNPWDKKFYPIIPESDGQYTGLTDKNGKKIFEGDIVKITGFHTTAIAAVKYGSASEKSTHWGWYFDDNDGHTYFLMSKAFCKDYNAIIIGNIHDNPELLEVTE